mgnify:CR=1 FL=1
MDFRPSEEQELLRRTVRAFAETEILPHVREWDEAQRFSPELMPKLAALGLLGIQYPEQYGGPWQPALYYRTGLAELARRDPLNTLSFPAPHRHLTTHLFPYCPRAPRPPDHRSATPATSRTPMPRSTAVCTSSSATPT